MINHLELRPGNIIDMQVNLDDKSVNGWTYLQERIEVEKSPELFSPTEISEGWLLSLGYWKIGGENGYTLYTNNRNSNYLLAFVNTQKGPAVRVVIITDAKIKYWSPKFIRSIHRLQNFVFEWAEEELTVVK